MKKLPKNGGYTLRNVNQKCGKRVGSNYTREQGEMNTILRHNKYSGIK